MNLFAKISSAAQSRLASWVAGAKSFDSWASLFGGGGGTAKISKPYAQSVWVFRAIQTVAGPIAACDLVFKDLDGQPIDDDDLDAFWKRPALNVAGKMSRRDFIEATVCWMNLHGQAYWVLDDTWLGSRKLKSPIYLARPDRITPLRAGDKVIAWTWIDADQRSHLLAPEQVIRPGFYNPYDEAMGLAPWQPAAIAAQGDYAAGVLAKNIMEANGDRGAYVIAKTGVITDTQRQQIEAMLRNKRELARKGEFKTAFLTGDITVEDPKVQAMDAQFVAQRLENRHEIFIAFGVPPSMADIAASYSVGSASDRFRLVEDTCIPVGMKICEAIDKVERLRSSLDREAELNWDNHSVMQQVRQERATVADKFLARGMPMSVANEWLQLGIPEFEGWEQGFLPMSMVPVTGAKTKPAPEPSPKDEAQKITRSLDNLEALFRTRLTEAREQGHTHTRTGEGSADDAPPEDPEREALWQKHMKLRAPDEKAVIKQWQKWCHEMRAETLAKLDGGKALGGIQHAGVLEIIFDLGKATLRLVNLLKQPITGSLEHSAEQLSEELGLEDPWKMEDPEVLKFLDIREPLIKGAAENVWNDIKGTLQEGLDEGESNDKLAKRVKEEFDGISKQRAKTIANTEVSAAYGHSRQKGMKASGVKWKEWLTAADDRVRAIHIHANEQQRPVDEPFEVDGEDLMHPGDPAGSAKNVINCRCVSIAIRKPKEEP